MDRANVELGRHKYIVFSQDHYNPLNVIRSLGEMGLKPISILYGEKPCLIPHCRFVDKLFVVKSLEEGYEVLLREYGNEEEKPFVYCSDDLTQAYLDNQYEELKDKFFVYNAGTQGRVTWLQNKDNITDLAIKVGLDVPKKEVVENGVVPKTLCYPVITKSLSSNMGGWKKDVHICQNEDELKEAYRTIKSQKLCIEEFIKKTGEFTVEIFSINDGKEVFMPYIADYVRFAPDNYGFFMDIIPFRDNELKEKIEKLLKESRYNGICEAEFMKGKDGKIYFLEVNFRASTWNYALTVGGGNLPYYWAKSTLLGRIPNEEMNLREKPFKAIVEPADFVRNVRQVGLLKWIMDWRSSECRYYYHKNDPKPFLYYLIGKSIRGKFL